MDNDKPICGACKWWDMDNMFMESMPSRLVAPCKIRFIDYPHSTFSFKGECPHFKLWEEK